jgi:competence protein ComEA
MRQTLLRHPETVRGVAATSLVVSIVLGAAVFAARRPSPAAIVIEAMTPLPSSTKAPTVTGEPVKVYVVGAVVRPGVYALPWDSRVEQAIASAGGATSDADLVRVNLAQPVHDGQQVYVPCEAEEATPALPTPVPSMPSAGAPSSSGQKININTASVAELETLSGIGPVLAQRIVDYRQANGAFQKPEDLKKVKGIGDSIFERIQGMVTVE